MISLRVSASGIAVPQIWQLALRTVRECRYVPLWGVADERGTSLTEHAVYSHAGQARPSSGTTSWKNSTLKTEGWGGSERCTAGAGRAVLSALTIV